MVTNRRLREGAGLASQACLVAVFAVVASSLPACGGEQLKPVELSKPPPRPPYCGFASNRDVDILLVVDDSGSMGEEQAKLAANVSALVDILEAPEVRANYRIGVTTTDNGNPWCSPTPNSPEAGHLVASSCRERLDDFVFMDQDLSQLACLDHCVHDELPLLPSYIQGQSEPAVRPWLEQVGGVSNLPQGLSMAEALACVLPQGTSGCGFESPLESMYLALLRAEHPDEPSYGFLRPGAALAIVFVTDEADCSYDKDWASIFDADGERAFWADPEATVPTSGLCWRAGVECVGDPSAYDSCAAVDRDELGALTEEPGRAVFHPLSRYTDLVYQLETEHQWLNPDFQVLTALIGGVDESGVPVYADATDTDPDFQAAFGVGPGCVDRDGQGAVPPVRLAEFVDAFTPDSLFSVCGDDYTAPFTQIADAITEQIDPNCFVLCPLDTDPESALLEPDCALERWGPGVPTVPVAECLRGPTGAYLPDPVTGEYTVPEGEELCYAALVDAQGESADPLDDLSAGCLAYNYPLEFVIVYESSAAALGGLHVRATCELSSFPAVDCPSIGLSG